MTELGMLRQMMLIRAFETALMRRPDHGFQLLSSGQEAVSVGLCAALEASDQLFCSGRSIAPALARGLDTGAVMAELLGRVGGINRGKAGRGHLTQPDAGFFGAHAVVGGNLTIAAGAALAFQMTGHEGVVACIFGDGAAATGALHETMNLAVIWKLPLLLVCDNNQHAVSTPRRYALAPERLSDLASPFGIPAETVDGMDVSAVRDAALRLLSRVREGDGPAFLECESERFHSHSTSTRDSRRPAEIAEARAKCPIDAFHAALVACGLSDPDVRARLQADVDSEVSSALAFADASPFPDAREALVDGDGARE